MFGDMGQQQYVGGNQPYGNITNQQYGFTGNPESAYGPGGMGAEREGERRREREGDFGGAERSERRDEF